MNGGKLTQKISFFDNTLVSDGAGGFLTGETSDLFFDTTVISDLTGINTTGEFLVLQTIASVKQIKASRVAENLQASINAVYEIKLRQRAGFNPQSKYTVKWDGKICNIVEITEDEKEKQWVLIVVSRGTGI